MKDEFGRDGLAGAEARFILLILSARLKPCPCYKALQLCFSAGFKGVPLLQSNFSRVFQQAVEP
jgi:hypothetical protein